MTVQSKRNLEEIIYQLTINPKISVRVFKSIMRTFRKSKTLREEFKIGF